MATCSPRKSKMKSGEASACHWAVDSSEKAYWAVDWGTIVQRMEAVQSVGRHGCICRPIELAVSDNNFSGAWCWCGQQSPRLLCTPDRCKGSMSLRLTFFAITLIQNTLKVPWSKCDAKHLESSLHPCKLMHAKSVRAILVQGNLPGKPASRRSLLLKMPTRCWIWLESSSHQICPVSWFLKRRLCLTVHLSCSNASGCSTSSPQGMRVE